jgi:hypothetical protein
MWWRRDDVDEPDPRAHEKLKVIFRRLASTQDYRKRQHYYHAAMYGGALGIRGLTAGSSTVSSRANASLSLNITRSVCDAVVSRVAAKAKPTLSYLTDGASYERQYQAEQLEKGVHGAFYQMDAYSYFEGGFRDACVFGTGQLRIQEDDEKREIVPRRYLPTEAYHDDGETRYGGQPRSLFTATYEDKGVLAWKYREERGYPIELATLIDRCGADKDDDAEYGYQSISRRVRVEEAWHMPSGPGAPDGRHVVGIETATLVDEQWDPDEWGPWPFASIVWSPSIFGTDARGRGAPGQGLVELGSGIQNEVNKLVRQIQQGHHLITGHWLVDVNSKVINAHVNNDLSTILRYAGIKPEYNAPGIISPEVYEHLWRLCEQYYKIAGVNEQSAAAQKPAGLDSGEAQRVYADQQTETLLEKGARYERFVKQCGELTTRAAKRLAKGGAYEVRALTDDSFETVDWKSLEDPDGFVLEVQETSSLPGTFSGRLATANDLQKLGVFDAQDILEISGLGKDLSALESRHQASRRLVLRKVDRMLREGEDWAPHPLLNLEEAIVLATAKCNEAESKDVADENLDLVRRFVVACTKLAAAKPPAAPQQAGPGGALLGPGAAPVAMPAPGGPPPGMAPPHAA